MLYQDPEKEGLVEMEDKNRIHKAETVLIVEWLNLPVSISEWILEESSNVFKGSPFLSIISWLFHRVDELSEITISRLHHCPIIYKQSYLLLIFRNLFRIHTCQPFQHVH